MDKEPPSWKATEKMVDAKFEIDVGPNCKVNLGHAMKRYATMEGIPDGHGERSRSHKNTFYSGSLPGLSVEVGVLPIQVALFVRGRLPAGRGGQGREDIFSSVLDRSSLLQTLVAPLKRALVRDPRSLPFQASGRGPRITADLRSARCRFTVRELVSVYTMTPSRLRATTTCLGPVCLT